MTDKIIEILKQYNFHDSGLNNFKYDAIKQLLFIEFEFWNNVMNCENNVEFQFKGISKFVSVYPKNIEFVPEGCYSANFLKIRKNLYEVKFIFELYPNIDCWQVTINFEDIQAINSNKTKHQNYKIA